MPKSKPAAPEIQVPAGPSYITDRQAEAMGLNADRAASTLADAGEVYEHVNRASHNERDDLIRWANGKWGDGAVDRLNAALDYLQQAGKLIAVP